MPQPCIYDQLKRYFPNDIQNINLSQLSSNALESSHRLSCMITTSLPHLSVQQIHLLCRKQEEAIMDRLVTKIDIYEEIASVCPMQCDLKSMSTEEMTVKISQYNSKLEQMNEAISDEEGSAEELDNKFDHEDSFQEMGYLHMRSIYDLSCVNTDKSIMSLFDHEEDPCDSDGQI